MYWHLSAFAPFILAQAAVPGLEFMTNIQAQATIALAWAKEVSLYLLAFHGLATLVALLLKKV